MCSVSTNYLYNIGTSTDKSSRSCASHFKKAIKRRVRYIAHTRRDRTKWYCVKYCIISMCVFVFWYIITIIVLPTGKKIIVIIMTIEKNENVNRIVLYT